MKKNNKHIILFEYDKLTYDSSDVFTKDDWIKFQKYYGKTGVPYFDLIHKGIQFKQFVGVITIGNLSIEVLPKADKTDDDIKHWRKLLIDMIFQTFNYQKYTTGFSSLKIRHNSILDLYFELFINEVEKLLHQGLINKYRKTEENINVLKGNLIFSKNIKENVIHKERFYTRHTTYDKNHLLHQILFKTLIVLKQVNNNPALSTKINNLIFNFPETSLIKIHKNTFDKIIYNAKSEIYKNAIEISKMILLNYHPDILKGNNNVLALMFDMNKLWEDFILISLKKYLKGYKIKAQQSKNFWQKERLTVKIRPDIVISKGDKSFVIDTKWKLLDYKDRPSDNDLKQLFTYHLYFKASKVALLYPGNRLSLQTGYYFDISGYKEEKLECSIIKIPITSKIIDWQKEIAKTVEKNWIDKYFHPPV